MQFSMKSLIGVVSGLSLLAATTIAAPINETDLIKDDNFTIGSLTAAMEKHDHGIVHLGDDGVLRSFAPNMTVLGYVQLKPAQIQKILERYGPNEHLREVYDGVNGEDVTQEQLLNPGEHLLPPGFLALSKLPPTSKNPLYDRGTPVGFNPLPPPPPPNSPTCGGWACHTADYCRSLPLCDLCLTTDQFSAGHCTE